jgi:hypothetical protein
MDGALETAGAACRFTAFRLTTVEPSRLKSTSLMRTGSSVLKRKDAFVALCRIAMTADLVQQPLYAPDAVFVGWQLLLWPTCCSCFAGPRTKQSLIVSGVILSLHDRSSCCYAALLLYQCCCGCCCCYRCCSWAAVWLRVAANIKRCSSFEPTCRRHALLAALQQADGKSRSIVGFKRRQTCVRVPSLLQAFVPAC